MSPRYYGMLLDGAGQHPDRAVEGQLLHLREMGLHTHRPLTLRLLHEAAEAPAPSLANSSLAGVLSLIGTWVTRSWLGDKAMAGMNTAFATMAHSDKPGESEDPVGFWAERIRAHRSTRVAMPDDDEVGRGIKTRKAYGGSATRATKAILCALMEREQRGGAPARGRLTVEHIMPRTLTDAWRRDLGEDAEQVSQLVSEPHRQSHLVRRQFRAWTEALVGEEEDHVEAERRDREPSHCRGRAVGSGCDGPPFSKTVPGNSRAVAVGGSRGWRPRGNSGLGNIDLED